jgi:septum formation protein
VSAPPAPPLLLASTSPQRRAILEQLGVPFDVVAPRYDEPDTTVKGSDPVKIVERHAEGKARSVAGHADGRPVLGVDTIVHCGGQVFGKPAGAEDAAAALTRLSDDTHDVVSGLCFVTPGWQLVEHETTRVKFRPLTPRDIATYVASGEWEGRAGGYAIQGRGAALVERIDGDYLNVVGLPGALLIRLLAERFAGVYGFG